MSSVQEERYEDCPCGHALPDIRILFPANEPRPSNVCIKVSCPKCRRVFEKVYSVKGGGS